MAGYKVKCFVSSCWEDTDYQMDCCSVCGLDDDGNLNVDGYALAACPKHMPAAIERVRAHEAAEHASGNRRR